MPNLDIAPLNKQFRNRPAAEILQWAWNTFGPEKIAASSSFQTQSIPLLHLISQNCPDMPVIFLDTGFHFSETLSFRDELQARFNLNLVVARPVIEEDELMAHEGLYRQDPDLCCYINKVEPMQRVLAEFKGWVNGVRRDQTKTRQRLSTLQPQATAGPLKIHPMLYWTDKEVWAYIDKHNLPSHPLFSQGYPSVGCAPCTRPILFGEDGRAGRWAGTEKTECGLHIDLTHSMEMQNE